MAHFIVQKRNIFNSTLCPSLLSYLAMRANPTRRTLLAIIDQQYYLCLSLGSGENNS